MPPENVRYPPSLRAKKYIKNTLPKCYNQLPKRSKIKEALASKNGYRRFYVNEKGELYRGWWKNDMQDGLGIQSDKVHYIVNEGEYHHGKAWGYGVTCKVEPNKMEDILYGGEFVNGVPEGQGEIHTDTYHFKGNVVNGKSSGVGVAWYDDGTIYFGSWFNGKRMGQGMQILLDAERRGFLLLQLGKQGIGPCRSLR
ncbi:MORN repeat-containing protein 3 isoform X2 [Halyomorpha halys]|uniref:MORN repeat-containing protein 3 isoform X2 n=1 Tax=Halyomorpha halys TaxID=286706 RepID=UPI0006D4F47D|nr:MORN repeat-containing protein 3-like isoform X2 [Halyomorpha halys]